MVRFLIALTILSILANIGIAYKFMEQRKYVDKLQKQLRLREGVIDQINRHMGRQMVFLHHSVGENWLNEGDLRGRLATMGIGVQSVTYGTDLGAETDICHWVPKFEQHMGEIVKWDLYAEGYRSPDRENEIIMFKSCYPNSNIVAEGNGAGNPQDTLKTLANYRATFNELKSTFAKYPNKTFIYVTAPPLEPSRTTPENAARARAFNSWVKSEFVDSYRRETNLNNLFVFDFFDVLADTQHVLKEAYRRRPGDSHPNREGSLAATNAFVEFLRVNGIANSQA